MIAAFIFDLDGTLADIGHRLHMIYPPAGQPKRWDEFHHACDGDALIAPVATLFRSLADGPYDLVIMTGRMDTGDVRQRTKTWLLQHGLTYDKLMMRAKGDLREDCVIKKEFLDVLRKTHKVVGVFEDRLSVCRMWHENGVHVFNVNQTMEEF